MIVYLLACNVPSATVYINLEGSRWSLEALELGDRDIQGQNTEAVPFTCISYTWGLGREPSPFSSGLVSDRTVPALSTAIRQRPGCERIWIDAFCVPPESRASERAKTLESMGFIYSQASDVVVILSNEAEPIVSRMATRSLLSPEHLDVLERDEWVSRAWTYQEAVNARQLYITYEGAGPFDPKNPALVEWLTFFSEIGSILSRMPEGPKRRRYPRLDAFEDLMADIATGPYLERSALQVMSSMDKRVQGRLEDHFYAMIGTISRNIASESESRNACGAFIALCEAKGDYSFAYSAAHRCETPGRRWRPVEDLNLKPILRAHSAGGSQHGHWENGDFYLDDMMAVTPAPIVEKKAKIIEQIMAGFDLEACEQDIYTDRGSSKVLQLLEYTGTGHAIMTSEGYFFPWEEMPLGSEPALLLSGTISWPLGRPGFARYRSNLDGRFRYVPGVFVGESTALAQSLCVSV